MVDTYGNHPSFCLMTLGNEYGGKDRVAGALGGHADSARPAASLLVGRRAAQTTANRQWTEDWRRPRHPWRQARSATCATSWPAIARPIIGHEIGQWMYFPDFNEMKKYTGVMAVKNFEMIRDDLEKKHLLDLAPAVRGRPAAGSPRCSTRRRSRCCCARRATRDFRCSTCTIIRRRAPRWSGRSIRSGTRKASSRRQAYRRYLRADGAAVADAETDLHGRRTVRGDRRDGALRACRPRRTRSRYGRSRTQQGREVAAGTLPAVTVPTGRLTPLGAIQRVAGQGPRALQTDRDRRAARHRVRQRVGHLGLSGQRDAAGRRRTWWSARSGTRRKRALAEGKKVRVFRASRQHRRNPCAAGSCRCSGARSGFPSQKPNTMGMLCDPQHPLLAQFPTESHSNWQWYELMQRSRLFILDDTPADYRPIVQVIDNFARNHKLGVVFEGARRQRPVAGVRLRPAADDEQTRPHGSCWRACTPMPVRRRSSRRAK